ncbi:hypothetical protein [Microbacterium sp. 13-71-7]|jgi:hypothetical protein|uniref:hypothetical protein n=1 Tax=Microbacterium sp. 13-71-7 TaxID=1970399 RepID=UPI000BDC2918|nr:hypothetical protein [Microbacterium sp. 13-71-7]OZB85379.1 MAG: hypothetical protein B7X32_03545 [Microbacterium sp. 13-71-7]
MTLSTYNDDKQYEMMAALLPGENENTPDAGSVIDDLRQILFFCYEYTIDRNTPKESTAGDLADAIVAYLFNAWNGKALDFEQQVKDSYLRIGLMKAEDESDPHTDEEPTVEPETAAVS